jgi:hypothetical protein
VTRAEFASAGKLGKRDHREEEEEEEDVLPEYWPKPFYLSNEVVIKICTGGPYPLYRFLQIHIKSHPF